MCPQTGMCIDEKCTHVLRRKRMHTDTHAHSKVHGERTGYLYVCTAAAYVLIYTFSQMLTWQVWYSHCVLMVNTCAGKTVHVSSHANLSTLTQHIA